MEVALNDVEVSIDNIQKLATELQVSFRGLWVWSLLWCRLRELNLEQQPLIVQRENWT